MIMRTLPHIRINSSCPPPSDTGFMPLYLLQHSPTLLGVLPNKEPMCSATRGHNALQTCAQDGSLFLVGHEKHLHAQKRKIFFLAILIFPVIDTIFPSNLCLTLLGHQSYCDATSATNIKGINCF